MATKTYQLNKRDIKRLLKDLAYPITHPRTFFLQLALLIDQSAMLAFRTLGASNGKGWVGYSPRTLKSKSGTWNIRYGTDLSGRAKGSYVPGKLRPGIRRYSGASKLLQAGGGFRQTFKTIRIGKDSLTYGTQHRLADKIMSNPTRNVLAVTRRNKMEWIRLFVRFYNKGFART